MLDELLDLLFPRRSIRDPAGFWITESDWKAIPVHPYCEEKPSLTKRGMGSLDRLVSAVRYDDSVILQRAIHTLKYRRVPGLTRMLAAFVLQATTPHMVPGMVLVPVPLHWGRYVERGFNQADLLARLVASATDLPLRRCLRRTCDTGHQAWRERTTRLTVMAHAFSVRRICRVPEHVVLIDDIATTGATLDACAYTLKSAGAKRVEAWVIARA